MLPASLDTCMENGSSEGQLGLDNSVKWHIGQADDGTEMLF